MVQIPVKESRREPLVMSGNHKKLMESENVSCRKIEGIENERRNVFEDTVSLLFWDLGTIVPVPFFMFPCVRLI